MEVTLLSGLELMSLITRCRICLWIKAEERCWLSMRLNAGSKSAGNWECQELGAPGTGSTKASELGAPETWSTRNCKYQKLGALGVWSAWNWEHQELGIWVTGRARNLKHQQLGGPGTGSNRARGNGIIWNLKRQQLRNTGNWKYQEMGAPGTWCTRTVSLLKILFYSCKLCWIQKKKDE